MANALESIFICVVLPVSIVLICYLAQINNDNKRAKVLIKAIEANNNIDADKLASALQRPRKTPREIFNRRLLRGCIFSLVGLALMIASVVKGILAHDFEVDGFTIPCTLGGVLVAIGISFLIVCYMNRQYLTEKESQRQRMTRQQFITLVEETRGAFRGFLNALCCGDTSTADDIAQEAYLKAYMTCDKLQEPEKFKSWIFRIGYTTFIDGKRKIRPCVEFNDAVDVIDDSVPAEHREQQVTALYAALNRLSSAERTALALFYLQDYSIKEIARIVKAGESAVKQHLSRGRRHLREILPPDILTP